MTASNSTPSMKLNVLAATLLLLYQVDVLADDDFLGAISLVTPR